MATNDFPNNLTQETLNIGVDQWQTWTPVRPVQQPGFTLPPTAAPVILQTNTTLAPVPSTLPSHPSIVQSLVGTPTGFQFSFSQLPNVASYRVYRATTSTFTSASLVQTIANDPTHNGAIVFTDTITAATGANYYYWVTSVDSSGQESLPAAAQTAAVQGSIGSTPWSIVGTISYTSTTTSITWSWSGLKIYRSDGTITNISDSSQQITGLTSSTTYYFYPYWSEAAKAIQWVTGGVGTPAIAQTAASQALAQKQYLRNQIPLSQGAMSGATAASGTGGGSGGGGGGGGCFSGSVRVRTPHGFVRFDEMPSVVEIENETGVHLADLIVHHNYSAPMLAIRDGLVTFEHLMKRGDGWTPALVFYPFSQIYQFENITVYNLHVRSEDEQDKHYILESGDIAHNVKQF